MCPALIYMLLKCTRPTRVKICRRRIDLIVTRLFGDRLILAAAEHRGLAFSTGILGSLTLGHIDEDRSLSMNGPYSPLSDSNKIIIITQHKKNPPKKKYERQNLCSYPKFQSDR
jgi:hypothetical protein